MKKFKYVIYIFLVLAGVYLALNYSKSNEEYIADVEEKFEEILKPGISKKDIQKYLDEKSAIYNETLKKNCRSWVSGDFKYKCEYASSLHTRIVVGSVINPVKSGAHVHLFFNHEENLVTYKIFIRHTFL